MSIAHEYLDAFKSALGIESPSRAFANLRQDELVIGGIQLEVTTP